MKFRLTQNKTNLQNFKKNEKALNGPFPSLIKYFLMGLITVSLFLVISEPYILNLLEAPIYSQFNIIFFASAIFITALLILLATVLKRYSYLKVNVNNQIIYYGILILLLTLTLCWETYLTFNITYYPIGDVVAVTFNKFQDFSYINSAKLNESNVDEHLQYYPNLWFMAGMFLTIYKACSLISFGIFSYKIILILNCICIITSILLATLIVKKMLGNSWSVVSLIIMCLIIGCSPMCVVTYSDTIGLLCTTIILFAYICISNKTFKWLLIFVFSIFGYFIKPTCIAVTVAIIIYEIWQALLKQRNHNSQTKQNRNFRKSMLSASAVFVCSLLVLFACNSLKNFGLEDNPQMHFGPTHYLMLGLNPETHGTFSQSDENLSASCANQQERNSKNIETAINRIENLGPAGLLKQIAAKSVINYGAGNFSSNAYYTFKQNLSMENELLSWLYNVKRNGQSLINAPTPFNVMCQIIWFMTLLYTIVLLYKGKINGNCFVMICSILIISLFILISECSQRYLFLYLTYFIILGTFGFKEILNSKCIHWILEKIGFSK